MIFTAQALLLPILCTSGKISNSVKQISVLRSQLIIYGLPKSYELVSIFCIASDTSPIYQICLHNKPDSFPEIIRRCSAYDAYRHNVSCLFSSDSGKSMLKDVFHLPFTTLLNSIEFYYFISPTQIVLY